MGPLAGWVLGQARRGLPAAPLERDPANRRTSPVAAIVGFEAGLPDRSVQDGRQQWLPQTPACRADGGEGARRTGPAPGRRCHRPPELALPAQMGSGFLVGSFPGRLHHAEMPLRSEHGPFRKAGGGCPAWTPSAPPGGAPTHRWGRAHRAALFQRCASLSAGEEAPGKEGQPVCSQPACKRLGEWRCSLKAHFLVRTRMMLRASAERGRAPPSSLGRLQGCTTRTGFLPALGSQLRIGPFPALLRSPGIKQHVSKAATATRAGANPGSAPSPPGSTLPGAPSRSPPRTPSSLPWPPVLSAGKPGFCTRAPSLPAPPGAPPSLPESVDAFCTRLRRHVRASCGTVPEARGLPLDRLYVEGELVQCPPEGWSGRSTGEPEERARAAVGHGQLLRAPGRSSPASRVAVLLGRAGLGKSLLAQKICLDWAVGKLPQFDFAFRFDCRALSLLRGGGCPGLGQLLGLAAGLGEVPEEVVGHVSRNPGKALLVFDSLEELLEQDGLPPGADGPARREPCGGVRAMVAGLFQKKLLAGCTLLATARPRDKLHQYVPRVDTLLETPGFSVPQAESFLARYFEGCPGGSEAASSIRNSPYLFSHCHNPELCRFLCESASAVGAEQLPPTLTGLFAKSLLRKLARLAEKEATATGHLHIRALAQVAWTLGQAQQNAFLGERFPSAEVEAFALQAGLVAPLALPRSAGGGEEACGYVFSSFVAQNFLVALHLVLAKEVKDKGLTKHLHLLSKSRKFLSSWDLVPRFLSGLLFLEDGPSCALLFGEDMEVDTEKMVAKKQKSLLKYFRKLSLKSLSPEKLLELLHCIHETENPYLLQHLALELGPDLSFLGFPLTPADVHVLHSAVRRATKAFTLDLRGSCIDTEGLRRLLCLRNVAAFRASLSTAIQLWKHLWEAGAGEQLRAATQKFSVAPFKVSTMRDVEELSALVHLQEEMREGYVQWDAPRHRGAGHGYPSALSAESCGWLAAWACAGSRSKCAGCIPARFHWPPDSPPKPCKGAVWLGICL
uniref:Class II major histocompatibility complex transactivator n=1 Tax=Varanus komodoensis TaxID=61221 RepID=A0A8D2LTQ0_VARKO